MVLFRVQRSRRPASRAQVFRSLRRVLGETRALAGCLRCPLSADVDPRLLLLEEWSDAHRHLDRLRLDRARVALSALDDSASQPDVRIDTVTTSQGTKFIAACRHDHPAPRSPPGPRPALTDTD